MNNYFVVCENPMFNKMFNNEDSAFTYQEALLEQYGFQSMRYPYCEETKNVPNTSR